MALGGGTFTTQNKVLPGTYINFISKATSSGGLSTRGVVAMGLELNWGADSGIITITSEDLIKNSLKVLGYSYSDDSLKGIRDVFAHATKLYVYKLTNGGVKASNTYATAKYCGTRGNDLKVVVAVNADDEEKFDVSLYLGITLIDLQTVSSSADLVDNDFVDWKKDSTLEATAGISLTGGTNGTVTGTNHQDFLDLIESYPDVNAIGYVGTDSTTKALYKAFAERMRNEVGVKLQVVLYNFSGDSEAVVNVKNTVSDESAGTGDLVYWATGVIAGTAVNESATNIVYDGEFTPVVDYTQTQLANAIESGEWTLHRVGDEIHVLEDINSLTTFTEQKGDVFKDNQTIRVIDQIATDTASIFNTKYLGKVPNDADGRLSLWNDVKKVHTQLQDMRAIENFSDEDITVEQGSGKKSIVISDSIEVINTMTKLYMTVVVG